MVEPFTGRGRRSGNAGYLTVCGVHGVAEGIEDNYRKAGEEGRWAHDEDDEAAEGEGGADGCDAVGGDAEFYGCCCEVSRESTIDPASVGWNSLTWFLCGS